MPFGSAGGRGASPVTGIHEATHHDGSVELPESPVVARLAHRRAEIGIGDEHTERRGERAEVSERHEEPGLAVGDPAGCAPGAHRDDGEPRRHGLEDHGGKAFLAE
jgi:hypothetical protein